MKIAVVGPGYAGLSLSLQFARSGVSVLASDVDVQKVQLLNHGKSYMKHIEPSVSAELVSSGKFSASADFNRIPDQSGGGADHLCANTATKNREPDISFVIRTGHMVAPPLAKWTLVVLESTTYPGQQMRILGTYMKIWRSVGASFVNLDNRRRKFWMGSVDGCLQNKLLKQKNFTCHEN